MQEFNRGVFDYLIATDESGLEGHDRDTNEPEPEEVDESSGPTRKYLITNSMSGRLNVRYMAQSLLRNLPVR